MADRTILGVGQEIALGDIGAVIAVLILREEMVEGLVLARPDIFGNGLIPFLGIGELRVDIHHHTPEGEEAVANHVAETEFGVADIHAHTLTRFRFDVPNPLYGVI